MVDVLDLRAAAGALGHLVIRPGGPRRAKRAGGRDGAQSFGGALGQHWWGAKPRESVRDRTFRRGGAPSLRALSAQNRGRGSALQSIRVWRIPAIMQRTVPRPPDGT